MGKILCYASCCCSREMYKYLWKENMGSAPAQSVQKYHRLFAEGFSENGYDVRMISFIAVPKRFRKSFTNYKNDGDGKLTYYYLPIANNRLIRYLSAIYNAYIATRKVLKQNGEAAVGDILCASVSLGCFLGAKREKKPFYAIVTDLPDMFAGYRWSLKYYVERWVIEHSDGYIVLTEQMNQKINKVNKPYVVLEGHVDASFIRDCELSLDKKEKFVIMYAGDMAKIYGIDYLVEGFIKANLHDAELHLYGNGDYADQIKKIAKIYENVKYYGERLNEEIVIAEQKASILINPRPTSEEYTKYSFPSKNLEYMLSGTPVLTTALPGMPKEYNDHVFLIDKENSEGIAEALLSIREMSGDKLKSKGYNARKFVLTQKNNIIQSQKVIKELIKKYK